MIILKEVSKDSSRFNEMAVLRKDKTGLPVNIYLDTNGTYKRGGHGKRIKFQPNTGEHPSSREMVPMTISDNPVILVKVNIELSARISHNSLLYIRVG